MKMYIRCSFWNTARWPGVENFKFPTNAQSWISLSDVNWRQFLLEKKKKKSLKNFPSVKLEGNERDRTCIQMNNRHYLNSHYKGNFTALDMLNVTVTQ